MLVALGPDKGPVPRVGRCWMLGRSQAPVVNSLVQLGIFRVLTNFFAERGAVTEIGTSGRCLVGAESMVQ